MNRAEKIVAGYLKDGYRFHGSALDFIKAVAETKTRDAKTGRAVRPQSAVLMMGASMNEQPFVQADLNAGKLVKYEREAVLTF